MKPGTKYDGAKPMWQLLPWEEVEEAVKVLTYGAKKYKPNNWHHIESGEDRYFSACMRHLIALRRGELKDRETGHSHYAHAICSLLFAFWHSRRNAKCAR